jgi:hypothetical protein
MLSISIVEGDILQRKSDLLILKYADAFHGVDDLVAKQLGFNGTVGSGKYALLSGKGLKAKQVLFVGVGPLFRFRYGQIRKFGKQALKLTANLIESPELVTMPIHGPGYGLDESEAFLSLIGGLMDGIAAGQFSETLKAIEIVEYNSARVVRLRHLLGKALEQHPAQVVKRGSINIATKRAERDSGVTRNRRVVDHKMATEELADYGAASEKKIRIFVAMPFKDDYSDEYDIAITEAAQHANIVCERIDKEAYVGDIMHQVRARIGSYNGMLALLNDANPNVFLEIGYAWAKDKPTVLMVKKGQTLPFDITGQKCIVYSNITDLRNRLKIELKALIENGTLVSRAGR